MVQRVKEVAMVGSKLAWTIGLCGEEGGVQSATASCLRGHANEATAESHPGGCVLCQRGGNICVPGWRCVGTVIANLTSPTYIVHTYLRGMNECTTFHFPTLGPFHM